MADVKDKIRYKVNTSKLRMAYGYLGHIPVLGPFLFYLNRDRKDELRKGEWVMMITGMILAGLYGFYGLITYFFHVFFYKTA